MKVLDSRTTITIEQFQRLSAKWQEQAELLRFVNRPGVVGVREHFEGPPIHGAGDASTAAGRALVLVMNHVDGLDLRDWRAERTLASHAERREVLRTLEQLADVLDWLHSGRATPSGRTVVHGDLSPGNVMVDEHGQATLVDFGLSKLTADHQTAEVWFTPGYAAPEVFEGKRTPNTDRYAFGAIAYFLLSGQAPPSTPEQLRAALRALPQVAAAAPERCERILSVCAAEPAGRPESLSAWVKDVRSAVVSTTVTGSSVRDAVAGSVGGPGAGSGVGSGAGESVQDARPAVAACAGASAPAVTAPGKRCPRSPSGARHTAAHGAGQRPVRVPAADHGVVGSGGVAALHGATRYRGARLGRARPGHELVPPACGRACACEEEARAAADRSPRGGRRGVRRTGCVGCAGTERQRRQGRRGCGRRSGDHAVVSRIDTSGHRGGGPRHRDGHPCR